MTFHFRTAQSSGSQMKALIEAAEGQAIRFAGDGAAILVDIESDEGANVLFDDEASTIKGLLNAYGVDQGVVQIFRQTVGHGDLTAAALNEALPLTGFPTDVIRGPAFVSLSEVFTDGGVAATAVTADIGDTANPDGLVDAVSVFTGAALGMLATAGDPTDQSWEYEADWETDGAVVTITSDVNVDTLTTGASEVFVLYIQPDLS